MSGLLKAAFIEVFTALFYTLDKVEMPCFLGQN